MMKETFQGRGKLHMNDLQLMPAYQAQLQTATGEYKDLTDSSIRTQCHPVYIFLKPGARTDYASDSNEQWGSTDYIIFICNAV
jgi:hypothetical protein